MKVPPPLHAVSLAAWLTLVAGCETESRTAVAPEKPAAAGTADAAAKSALVIGKFDDHSSGMR